MSREVPVPLGLSEGAGLLWNDVVCRGPLGPDALVVLEEACRTVDLVDGLEEVVASSPLVVAGSTGQPVIHPAVSEVRSQRVVLAVLWRYLGLEEGVDGVPAPVSKAGRRSMAARKAARARWTLAPLSDMG